MVVTANESSKRVHVTETSIKSTILTNACLTFHVKVEGSQRLQHARAAPVRRERVAESNVRDRGRHGVRRLCLPLPDGADRSQVLLPSGLRSAHAVPAVP